MDYSRILKTFQDLLERAEYGDKIYRDDQPYQRFGVGAITIAFRGNKNVREFVKAVDELWKIDKELYETYSLKNISRKIH
ncbi:hypothetical protein ACLHWY_23460 [Priestia aryabhattai]|uniref:hypothetical protein n=1 Tax=Priestia aryabhattai TaxID=412384 RepID=UPI003983758B